ncbi:hypothetical protein SCOCK_20133 [Actinacidiphila cocklensis]|uniref:Uncharacterized protein n=1 Tax=Actinacidiphila cocklensis TaxID=887465 RepID=A0A9W4GRZ8_9ACTN|nr:hypothetical protein SCOCK_20133 [Actinacidiphila cocklensis]
MCRASWARQGAAGYDRPHAQQELRPRIDPAVEEERPGPRGGGGGRPGGRGGDDGLLRGRGALREDRGRAHGHPGGPLRQAPGLPDGAPRLPDRRPHGHAGAPAGRARTAGAAAVRVGFRGGARREGAGGAGRAHLRRGAARRRAGRTGLGPRPAGRGRGRGVPGGRRRPARDRGGLRPGPRRPARRAGRPPGAGVEGVACCRVGERRGRPGRRAPVHRRVGGGEARFRRHPAVAAGAARRGLEDRGVPGAGLGHVHR